MANRIIIKNSSTASAQPTTGDLELGELAINSYDGKLYLKKNDGADAIVEIGGAPGGSSTQLQYNNAGAFGGMSGFTFDSGLMTIEGLFGSTAPISINNYSTAASTKGLNITTSYQSTSAIGIQISGTAAGTLGLTSILSGTGATAIRGAVTQATSNAGYFENTAGTDTEVTLATGAEIIIGSVDATEVFKVTDAGALTAAGGVDALTSATTVVDVATATAPTTGQVLTATSGTAATWQTPSGGGTPGGSDTQIQYNNGGAFGGMSSFTFDDTTNVGTIDLTNSNINHPSLAISSTGIVGRALDIETTDTGTGGIALWARTSGSAGFSSAVYAEALATTGVSWGVSSSCASASGLAGIFTNNNGDDTVVELGGGDFLLRGTNAAAEKFKITDAGALTAAGGVDTAGTVTVDTINEHTAASGVTIEGILFKDNSMSFSGSVNPVIDIANDTGTSGQPTAIIATTAPNGEALRATSNGVNNKAGIFSNTSGTYSATCTLGKGGTAMATFSYFTNTVNITTSGSITSTKGIDKLTHASGAVDVSASAAAVDGARLVATSATAAEWRTPYAGLGANTNTIDFDGAEVQYIAVTSSVTFTASSNMAAGKRVKVFLYAVASTKTVTLNTSWRDYGETGAISVPGNKYLELNLTCLGTTEATVQVSAVLEN